MNMKRTILLGGMAAAMVVARAQGGDAAGTAPVTFAQYISLVGQNNLGLLAEMFSVKIADANLVSQKVFPDPELTVGAFDNQDRLLKRGGVDTLVNLLGRGLTVDLEYSLELGGKRRSRIRLAKSEAELAAILLEGSFRELRADAAMLFLESLKQQMLLEVKQESYTAMRQLYAYDSLRYKLGEIHETDMRQTKLEAAALLNEVYGQEAELKSSMAELCELAGRAPDVLLRPVEAENFPPAPAYRLPELRAAALENRTDLAAAMKQKEVSANELKLTKAERRVDLGLNLGFDLNAEAENVVAPVPAFHAVRAGVTVPLRLSNLNRGAVKASQLAVEQAEVELAAMELQILREVTQAFFAYEGVQKQLAQYNLTILDDAKKVYDGILFQYRSGETNLLAVMVAQRTYNDIRESHVETLFEFAASIVEINRMSGTWEVGF